MSGYKALLRLTVWPAIHLQPKTFKNTVVRLVRSRVEDVGAMISLHEPLAPPHVSQLARTFL